MTERKTDEAIRQKASRLRLTFFRDHVAEVLDIADKTKMTPREVIDYVFGKEIEQRDVNRYKQALMAAHFPAVKTLWDEGTKNGPDRSALLGHNFVYQETKPHGFYSSYFHQRISS